MADDLSIFDGLPGGVDEDRLRAARRKLRLRNAFEPEGPLPPRPSASGVGGKGVIPGPPPAVPANTVPPAVTGTVTVGSTLSCSTGTWTHSPTSYSYSWISGSTQVGTAATYVIQAGDAGNNIFCRVQARNAAGFGTPATSNTVGPVPGGASPPVNTAAPVASGSLTVGSTLSVTNGTWTNSPTGYTYQWLRGGTAISGATSATYVTVTADGGTNVSCTVTATNAAGSASATSNALAITPLPAFAVIAGASLPTVGTTAAIDTTGADLLIVHVAATNSATAIVSDSKSNTWTNALGAFNTDAIFYCQGGNVGSGHTFTLAVGGASIPSFNVVAFSGSKTSPLDQIVTSAGSGTAGPLTPSVANALVIAVANYNYTGGTVTFPSGFTGLTNSQNGSTYSGYVAYQTQTTPTAVTAAWSASLATAMGSALALFKLAQAPGALASTWSLWDASFSTPAVVLSNHNMTANTTSGNNWATVRSTTSHNSGKWYFECLFTSAPSGQNYMIGAADSTFVPINTNLGTSGNSFGLRTTTGSNLCTANFTSNYLPGSFTVNAGDVLAIAIDFTAGKVWFAWNNVWFNSSNPATGTLPILSFSEATVGPLFAATSMYFTLTGPVTLQATPASQKYLPPGGFQAWDGGPVTPVTSTWSAADASINGMTLSNSNMTIANVIGSWVTTRATASKTSGKLYVEILCGAPVTGNAVVFGVGSAGINVNTYISNTNYSGGVQPAANTPIASSGFTTNYTVTLSSPLSGDVWAMAVDFATGNMWFAINNVWINSGNPVAGTGPGLTFIPATVGALFPAITVSGSNGGIWTLQPTPASQKYLPPGGFQAWDGGPVTPIGSPPSDGSVWNTTDVTTVNALVLSNSNSTIATGGSHLGWATVRNTASHSTGKLYIEFVCNTTATEASWLEFGVASSGMDVTQPLGAATFSGGIAPGTPASTGNAGGSTGFTVNYYFATPLPHAGDVWAMAVDFATGNMWFGVNNVWFNSSNPATGTAPYLTFVPATVGALFAAASLGNGHACGSYTIHPTATTQTYAPPSGFTAWG